MWSTLVSCLYRLFSVWCHLNPSSRLKHSPETSIQAVWPPQNAMRFSFAYQERQRQPKLVSDKQTERQTDMEVKVPASVIMSWCHPQVQWWSLTDNNPQYAATATLYVVPVAFMYTTNNACMKNTNAKRLFVVTLTVAAISCHAIGSSLTLDTCRILQY